MAGGGFTEPRKYYSILLTDAKRKSKMRKVMQISASKFIATHENVQRSLTLISFSALPSRTPSIIYHLTFL